MKTGSQPRLTTRRNRQIHFPVDGVQERSRHISMLLNHIRDDGPALSGTRSNCAETALQQTNHNARVIDHPGKHKPGQHQSVLPGMAPAVKIWPRLSILLACSTLTALLAIAGLLWEAARQQQEIQMLRATVQLLANTGRIEIPPSALELPISP